MSLYHQHAVTGKALSWRRCAEDTVDSPPQCSCVVSTTSSDSTLWVRLLYPLGQVVQSQVFSASEQEQSAHHDSWGVAPCSAGKGKSMQNPLLSESAQDTSEPSSSTGLLSTVVKSIIERVSFSLAVWSWAGYLKSLCLSFLTCRKAITIVSTAVDCYEISQYLKVLRTGPGT